MSSASNLFRHENDLKSSGYRVTGLDAKKTGAPPCVPLFDAKMARQFEWRAASLGFSGNQFRKLGACNADGIALRAGESWSKPFVDAEQEGAR